MVETTELYIGLMSGTSLDGIDAALFDLTDHPRLIAARTYPLPPSLRAELLALCRPGSDEIERMGPVDRHLGLEFGAATTALLREHGIAPGSVRAIGSHGQTIRHRPKLAGNAAAYPFTLQIGDPTSIAEATGITTVADFRRRDIAAGGQGAPLVPAFHRRVFARAAAQCAVVNIGGIANITGLGPDDSVAGFDTGPGNTLLDQWHARHRGTAYDTDGAWAATGRVNPELLATCLRDPYFSLPAPKSTGREYFDLDWLQRQLDTCTREHDQTHAAADVQATLTALTAQTIARGIAALPFTAGAIFVCGGGAYNRHLMARLETLVQPHPLASTAQLGIAPEWVEAGAFAWLAQQTLRNLPGNLPAATGASGYRILGAIYPA